MKLRNVIFAALLLGLFGMMNFANAEEAKDGKTIFTAAKCNQCHSVTAQGVDQLKKNDKYPDLSKVGEKVKADFIVKYLNKEEKMNDKAHPIKFKGEAAELDVLAKWLAGLK